MPGVAVLLRLIRMQPEPAGAYLAELEPAAAPRTPCARLATIRKRLGHKNLETTLRYA